jgi:hypothetical protein
VAREVRNERQLRFPASELPKEKTMRRQTDNPNVSRQQDHVLNSRTVEEKELDRAADEATERAGKEDSVTTKNTASLPSSDDFGLGVDFCKRLLFFGGTLKHPQSLV